MGLEITAGIVAAFALTAVSSYLLGSINFAIIVTALFTKQDIRKFGSGNAGMTNVLRTLGKGPAALTLLGDVLKGVAAVILGRLLFMSLGGLNVDDAMTAGYIAGVFALLGHIFPLYYGFRGGKGILVSSGILLVIDPAVFGISFAVFLVILFFTRIVSISSISAAITFPIATYAMHMLWGRPHPLTDTALAATIGIVIIIMHRANIKRLLNGTEHKFGQKK